MLDELELYGADSAYLLARWDAGTSVHTIEMGGLGPGYEQALQVAMFEILREMLDREPDHSLWDDKDVWKAFREDLSKAVMPRVNHLGLSGAQWGAAVSLASAFYMRGPRDVMKDKAGAERGIMVCRKFPEAA